MADPRQTSSGSEPPLAAGFSDPVHDAQRGFRAVMMAMSRPGLIQALDVGSLTPPQPLSRVGAALALTLFDYDTPIWLDPPLARSEAVKRFLRFHTGAPIVTTPVDAVFALVADPTNLTALGNFNQGTADYPDRSTTIILTGQSLEGDQRVNLSGPGVKDMVGFATHPIPAGFWNQVRANNAQFPRGVDLVFAGSNAVAAVPRSTTITIQEG